MRKYLPFILIILMVVLIIGSSLINSTASNVPTRSLTTLINKLLIKCGEPQIPPDTLNLIIRKLAHFTEYLVLTILLSIGFINTVKKRGWAFLISSITAGFISLVDELFIQSISVRNSSLFDILVDFSGIGAGLLAFALMLWMNVRAKG